MCQLCWVDDTSWSLSSSDATEKLRHGGYGGAAEDGGDGEQRTKDARLQWKGSKSGSGFWLLNWNN